MMPFNLLPSYFTIVAVLSLPLFACCCAAFWALIPRKLDGDPYCRHCCYNLTGSPGVRCSECGSDLRIRRAIRHGRYRRRWGAFGASLVGLVFLAPLDFLAVRGIRAGATWEKHFPVWMLLLDVEYAPPAQSTNATTEILARIEAKSVGTRAADQIGRVFLRKSTSDAAYVSPPHPSFLLAARVYQTRLFSAKVDAEYAGSVLQAAQLITPAMTIRGEPTEVYVEFLLAAPSGQAIGRAQVLSASVNGHPLPVDLPPELVLHGGGSSYLAATITIEQPVGPAIVDLEIELRVLSLNGLKPLAVRHEWVSAGTWLHDGAVHLPRLRRERLDLAIEKLEEAMRRVSYCHALARPDGSSDRVPCEFSIGFRLPPNIPAGIVGDFYLQIGDVRTHMGSVCVPSRSPVARYIRFRTPSSLSVYMEETAQLEYVPCTEATRCVGDTPIIGARLAADCAVVPTGAYGPQGR